MAYTYKRDCFAFRTNGCIAQCTALNKPACKGCAFYKPADGVEYYETTYNGQKVCGYNDIRKKQLKRLMDIRTEIEKQIAALEG